MSNEMKHTPGPWRVDERDNYSAKVDDEYIGGTVTLRNDTDVALVFEKRDVSLIAAAPDLLAALKQIMSEPEIEEEGRWHPTFDGISFSRGSKMWDDAIAAIAKAERRQ